MSGDEAAAVSLLKDVYGDFEVDGAAPLPIPEDEAGACANGDRRYLWTDAFGVLALTSLASRARANIARRGKLLTFAGRLADAVHDGLGTPRGPSYPMRPDPSAPSKFVGLRIGKVNAKKMSDYGMSLDGMYWHYVDKWLFALLRLGQEADDAPRIIQAAAIAKSVFPFFFDPRGCGVRWKLNMDASDIPGCGGAPNGDTLNALVVFQLIQSEAAKRGLAAASSLEPEIDALSNCLRSYRPRFTTDPLGWGLDCWVAQWAGRPAEFAPLAPRALHIAHMELPFRLYGAMLGARVTGIGGDLAALFTVALNHESKVKGREEHSAINRVMLAAALLEPGGCFTRQPSEPQIPLPQ